jgi:hypothetical protein
MLLEATAAVAVVVTVPGWSEMMPILRNSYRMLERIYYYEDQ